MYGDTERFCSEEEDLSLLLCVMIQKKCVFPSYPSSELHILTVMQLLIVLLNNIHMLYCNIVLHKNNTFHYEIIKAELYCPSVNAL